MKKKTAIALFLSLFSLYIIPLPVLAALKNTNPTTVSAYLSDIGLQTGTWNQEYDTQYFSCSPYKDIGEGFPLPNNISYHVNGTAKKANTLKLLLHVNNKSTAKAAHKELLNAASVLVKKSLGVALPKVVSQAIEKGTKASAKISNASIELTREDWPKGNGYDLKFVIK